MTMIAIVLAFAVMLWTSVITLERPPERPCGDPVRVRAIDIIEP